jgi:tripartite-type tricarboxylate transporter receptor subunit TctC
MISPSSNIVIYPHTVKNPKYQVSDFVAIAIAGQYDTAMAINPQSSAKDFRTFLAAAKADSSLAAYGTPGTGSLPHFIGMQLAGESGIAFKHVPYRGTGPAISDAVAGHVPSVLSPAGTLMPQAKAGKLRLIAVTGSERNPQIPEVPTFRELGYPQLSASAWFGFVARAGTPPAIVDRLNAVVARAMKDASVLEKLAGIDLQPHVVSPAEFAAKIRTESAQWAEIVKATGFSADSQ